MDCEQFDNIVMDVLYGEIDEKQSADAKRHVEGCERCASTLSDLRAARKSAILPLVDAPSGFEHDLMEAAKQAQKQVPWPRRLSRWVSWAGGYAMRPQIAMAALLLLMIGSSLLLIRGGPGSEQVGVVRITEQGVPEREGANDMIAPDPADLPPRSPSGAGPGRMGDNSAGRHQPRSDKGANAAAGKSAAEAIAEAIFPDAGDAKGNAELVPSPTGSRASAQQLNTVQGPGGPSSDAPPADAYAEAVAMYRAQDYANAYRRFDAIALEGGPNAASAALYAAKAVRASSGCSNALPRFESIAARFGNSGAGVQAKWEAATCARITGDYTRARILYRNLARIEGQRKRAERELARISTRARKRAAKPSASDKPAKPPASRKNADESPPNAFDSAY